MKAYVIKGPDGEFVKSAIGYTEFVAWNMVTDNIEAQIAKGYRCVEVEIREITERAPGALRVLLDTDPYCPSCGHNRDKSSVSSIAMDNGERQCQMCGATWAEQSSQPPVAGEPGQHSGAQPEAVAWMYSEKGSKGWASTNPPSSFAPNELSENEVTARPLIYADAAPPAADTVAAERWMPIENAPRLSGRLLVAYKDSCNEWHVREAWWCTPREGCPPQHCYWRHDGDVVLLDKSVHGIGASHWLSLPQPPKGEKG